MNCLPFLLCAQLLLSIGKLQRELCREHMEATICDLWIWQKVCFYGHTLKSKDCHVLRGTLDFEGEDQGGESGPTRTWG